LPPALIKTEASFKAELLKKSLPFPVLNEATKLRVEVAYTVKTDCALGLEEQFEASSSPKSISIEFQLSFMICLRQLPF